MNIFDKRPLCLILCIMLGGFVVFSISDHFVRCALIAICLLIFVLALLIKSKRGFLIAVSITLFFSIASSYLYFDNYFFPHERYKGVVYVNAVVDEITPTQYGTSITITTNNINKTSNSRHKLIIFLSKEEGSTFRSGDTIYFYATLREHDSTDLFDSKSYYAGRGIGSAVDLVSEIHLLSHPEGNFNVDETLKNIRDQIFVRSVKLSDEPTANFLSALLLGDRNKLPYNVSADFRKIGISHILALSGMHLAIISFGLGKLLSVLGVAKKLRIIILLGFISLYILLTGCPISVLRAGIMLAITNLLFLFSKSNDSVTSLSIAVFLIVLFSPYSIYDISLWLSAFATLGVIVFAEISKGILRGNSMIKSLARPIVLGLLSTVFAVSSTLLLSASAFGATSLLAPISTLIFSPLTELIIYIGSLMLLLGDFIPLGQILIPLTKFTTNLAESLGAIKGVYLSLDYTIVKASIIFLTALLFIFLTLRIESKRLFATALASVFFSVLLLTYYANVEWKYEDSISYYSSDGESQILIKGNGKCLMINSATYSTRSASSVVSILKSNKLYGLDSYFYTHYSNYMIDEIATILLNVSIKNLYIPIPKITSEFEIYEKINALALDKNIGLICYSLEPIVIDDVTVTCHYSSWPSSQDKRFVFSIDTEHTDLLYLSSGALEGFAADTSYPLLTEYDNIVFGKYGADYYNVIPIEDLIGVNDTVILDSSGCFLTDETFDTIHNKNCNLILYPNQPTIIYP